MRFREFGKAIRLWSGSKNFLWTDFGTLIMIPEKLDLMFRKKSETQKDRKY